MSDRSGHDAGRARARNIATGARSLPEPLREPFVENACGGDASLLAEVRSLLGWEPRPAAPEAPATGAVPPETPAPVTPAPPPELGSDLLRETPPDEPDLDRVFDATFGMSPEQVPPAEPPAGPDAARRSFPWVLLLTTAAVVWLAFIAVTLSRQVSRTSAERDRAILEEAQTHGRLSGVEDDARRARHERDLLAGLLATEAGDTLWRDRIAMRRFLDRAAWRIRSDPKLDSDARGRLLAAIASGYRARGFLDRADSVAFEADTLRGLPAPPDGTPADAPAP